MSILIRNANIIAGDDVIERRDILTEGALIKSVGVTSRGTPRPGETVIDAGGLYASAGFIDIHTHGAGGADYMDASPEAYMTAARASAYHGATTVIPTTMSGSNDEIFQTFAVFDEISKKDHGGADMPGLHLEGPYFSMKERGAQDAEYVRDPDPAEYMAVLERGRGVMRWSVSPELPGALDFGDELTSRGILPSIAHSDAPLENVREAYGRGWRLITHFMCCTSSLRYEDGWRPGIIEAAYSLDGMYIELIGDGFHVDPRVIYMCYKIKGADRLILCTDSMRAAGTRDKESVLGSLKNGREVYIADGVAKLAGTHIFAASVATCENLLQTAALKAGIPLTDAVKTLTSTSAAALGLNDRGRLAPRLRADIVLFDAEMRVKAVVVGGKVVRNDLR